MKIWLDDIRPAPMGWIQISNPKDVYPLIDSGIITEISLDHDLGDEIIGNGYDVLLYIEEKVVTVGMHPPVIYIHTQNPVARLRMVAALKQIGSYSSYT